MFSPLLIVLPIFALIFAGWFARRIEVLGPQASSELNRFVVYLSLPALLFDIVAHAQWTDIWRPGFIAAFGLSAAVIFVIAILLRWRRQRHLADAAIDGLNAGYANTGFIGFPLTLAALGPAALPLTLIAAIITVCVLFGAAIVVIEIGLQTETSAARVAMKVARSLFKNPLLLAPAIGALVPISGASIPLPLESFLKLLGGAASPCALVALGLFLAAKRDKSDGNLASIGVLVGMKLIVQPLIAWLVATALGLPPLETHAAVLLAALPTGTGPFMLAEFYRRDADITSRTVLISTVLSALTLSLYLALVK
jgi:predicted permease